MSPHPHRDHPPRPGQAAPGRPATGAFASALGAAGSTAGTSTRDAAPLRFSLIALFVLLTLALLSGCGPDDGLRVEVDDSDSPNILQTPTESAGPADTPFSLDRIRELISASAGVAVTGSAPGMETIVADCRDCLKFSTSFTSGDKKFQVVTVANPKQRSEVFAGAVISDQKGKPKLELIATGNQLALRPGKNGTLVVQEAMYADGDESCCPSGWSVQIFRFHDGRFEPGQRFTRLDGEM